MADAGRLLLVVGLALALLGAVIWAASRLSFRGLPGDIRYEADGLRIYIPIVTCLVLSILLSLAIAACRWLAKK